MYFRLSLTFIFFTFGLRNMHVVLYYVIFVSHFTSLTSIENVAAVLILTLWDWRWINNSSQLGVCFLWMSYQWNNLVEGEDIIWQCFQTHILGETILWNVMHDRLLLKRVQIEGFLKTILFHVSPILTIFLAKSWRSLWNGTSTFNSLPLFNVQPLCSSNQWQFSIAHILDRNQSHVI